MHLYLLLCTGNVAGLYTWVRTMHDYFYISREVAPKKHAVEIQQAAMTHAQLRLQVRFISFFCPFFISFFTLFFISFFALFLFYLSFFVLLQFNYGFCIKCELLHLDLFLVFIPRNLLFFFFF